jgi:hypothetical protein
MSSELTPTGNEQSLPKTGKKPYQKPELQNYGYIRDVTMGATKGTGDSRFPMTKRP